MKFKNKKQMAISLLDGLTFINNRGDKIYYDEEYSPPFIFERKGCFEEDTLSAWDYDIEWEKVVIKKWYEEIPEQGILCQVCDTKDGIKFTQLILKYLTDKVKYRFKGNTGSEWKYAVPLTQEEASNMLWIDPNSK